MPQPGMRHHARSLQLGYVPSAIRLDRDSVVEEGGDHGESLAGCRNALTKAQVVVVDDVAVGPCC